MSNIFSSISYKYTQLNLLLVVLLFFLGILHYLILTRIAYIRDVWNMIILNV